MKSKKALSDVIAMVIMIALSLTAIAIVYLTVETLVEDTLMSPEVSCSEFLTSKPISIQKACYNSNSSEIELNLLRLSENPYIRKLKFIVSYETGNTNEFTCDNSCSNCEILGVEAKTYYFTSQPAPKEITLFIDECILNTQQIINCT